MSAWMLRMTRISWIRSDGQTHHDLHVTLQHHGLQDTLRQHQGLMMLPALTMML
jgi:hypothetical protein